MPPFNPTPVSVPNEEARQELEEKVEEGRIADIKMIMNLPDHLDSLDQIPEEYQKYFTEVRSYHRDGSPNDATGYVFTEESRAEALIEKVPTLLPKALADTYTKMRQNSFFTREEYEAPYDPCNRGDYNNPEEASIRYYNDQTAKTIEDYLLNNSSSLNVIDPLSDLLKEAPDASFALLDIFAPQSDYMKHVWAENHTFRDAITYFMKEGWAYPGHQEQLLDSIVAAYRAAKFDIEVTPYYDKYLGTETYIKIKSNIEGQDTNQPKVLDDQELVALKELQRLLVESVIIKKSLIELGGDMWGRVPPELIAGAECLSGDAAKLFNLSGRDIILATAEAQFKNEKFLAEGHIYNNYKAFVKEANDIIRNNPLIETDGNLAEVVTGDFKEITRVSNFSYIIERKIRDTLDNHDSRVPRHYYVSTEALVLNISDARLKDSKYFNHSKN